MLKSIYRTIKNWIEYTRDCVHGAPLGSIRAGKRTSKQNERTNELSKSSVIGRRPPLHELLLSMKLRNSWKSIRPSLFSSISHSRSQANKEKYKAVANCTTWLQSFFGELSIPQPQQQVLVLYGVTTSLQLLFPRNHCNLLHC